MTGRHYSPTVAFAMNALAMAYRAKSGQLQRDEAKKLAVSAAELLPDSGHAALAARMFEMGARKDPVRAGEALLDVVGGWFDRLPPEEQAEMQAETQGVDPALHPWQTRKDCGL
jgi:hypothetical protein